MLKKCERTYKQFEQDLQTNPALFQEYNREQANVLNRIKNSVGLSRIWASSTQRNKEFGYFIKYYFGMQFRREYYKSYFVHRTCPDVEKLVRKSIAYFIL